MARVNKSQYAILGCLAIRPMSAYQMKVFIKRTVANFWMEGEGQLYPTLRKLTEQGLVTYNEEPAEKSGVKKIYVITKAGKAVLLVWLENKVESSVYRNELLLKMFFGGFQSAAKNIRLLEDDMKINQLNLAMLQSIRKDLPNKGLPTNRIAYSEITLDYGVDVLKAEIKWAKQSIAKLQAIIENKV